jgi:hypothetical protein
MTKEPAECVPMYSTTSGGIVTVGSSDNTINSIKSA